MFTCNRSNPCLLFPSCFFYWQSYLCWQVTTEWRLVYFGLVVEIECSTMSTFMLTSGLPDLYPILGIGLSWLMTNLLLYCIDKSNERWLASLLGRAQALFGRTYCCCGWFVRLICCERKTLFHGWKSRTDWLISSNEHSLNCFCEYSI